MAIQIPKRHIPGIIKLRQLSEPIADKLIEALSSAPLIPDAEDMTKHIASQLAIPPQDLGVMVDTIYSINYVRGFSEATASRFLSDLIQALKASGEPELLLKQDEVSQIRSRFKRLLSIENINLLSKAVKLRRNGERLYCEAKILSDIRPVFHDEVASLPAGAVVTHTLKLGYHKTGEHKEIFIVLEDADLKALKLVLERAEAKAKTLESLLVTAKLPNIGM